MKAGAVWLKSPVFAVEMMAAVINRVQTSPASAHKNTFQGSSGLLRSPKFTPNVSETTTSETGEKRQDTLCISCASVYFVSMIA